MAGFWARQFSVPDVVRQAKFLAYEPRPILYTGELYRDPMEPRAQAIFNVALVSFAFLWICAPISLVLSIQGRGAAIHELEEMAGGRRVTTHRSKVIAAFWIHQSVLWFFWFFLGLFILMGGFVGLSFAIGVFH